MTKILFINPGDIINADKDILKLRHILSQGSLSEFHQERGCSL